MSVEKYLETAPHFELRKYISREDYSSNSIAFSGAPRKHPYDRDKIILIKNPFRRNTVFYEFRLADVVHAEDLPSLGTETGESLKMIRIWVKKGSFALRFVPFEVREDAAEAGEAHEEEVNSFRDS